MKKHIGFITLDFSLARWLSDTLRTSGRSQAAQELIEGLGDLMSGSTESLMLEIGEGQHEPASEDILRCGSLAIDLRLRRVIRDGAEISLTPKEFDILYFLARNRGGYLPRSRFIRLYGKATTYWMTATLWPSFGSCERKSSPTPTHPSIF